MLGISNGNSVWLASPATMDTFGSSCACAGEGSAEPAPRSAAAVRATAPLQAIPASLDGARYPPRTGSDDPPTQPVAHPPSTTPPRSRRSSVSAPRARRRPEVSDSRHRARPVAPLRRSFAMPSCPLPWFDLLVMTPAIRETRRGATSSCHGGGAAPLVWDVDDRALRDPALARPERRCRLASEHPPRCGPWNRHSVSTPAIRYSF